MTVAAAALTMVLVFIIAAVVIGREAHRLDAVPPTPVFDPDEALAWIAEHLPGDVTAVLSYDEVRVILDLALEFLRSQPPRTNGSMPTSEVSVVVGAPETVDYVLAQAPNAGLVDLSAPHVHAVVEAQLAYLEAIGAVGPEASD